MVVAIPFVIAAGNKQVATLATTFVAITTFTLTGLNGAVPAQSVIDGPVLNYLPNTLPTRVLIAHLVPAESWTGLGIARLRCRPSRNSSRYWPSMRPSQSSPERCS